MASKAHANENVATSQDKTCAQHSKSNLSTSAGNGPQNSSRLSAPEANNYQVIRLNHQNKMANAFESMLYEQMLCDVTIICNGQSVKAHRVILAASSTYFKEIFNATPTGFNPIVFLKNFTNQDLNDILDFVYKGELVVPSERLPSLIDSAKSLGIAGLATLRLSNDNENNEERKTSFSVTTITNDDEDEQQTRSHDQNDQHTKDDHDDNQHHQTNNTTISNTNVANKRKGRKRKLHHSQPNNSYTSDRADDQKNIKQPQTPKFVLNKNKNAAEKNITNGLHKNSKTNSEQSSMTTTVKEPAILSCTDLLSSNKCLTNVQIKTESSESSVLVASMTLRNRQTDENNGLNKVNEIFNESTQIDCHPDDQTNAESYSEECTSNSLSGVFNATNQSIVTPTKIIKSKLRSWSEQIVQKNLASLKLSSSVSIVANGNSSKCDPQLQSLSKTPVNSKRECNLSGTLSGPLGMIKLEPRPRGRPRKIIVSNVLEGTLNKNGAKCFTNGHCSKRKMTPSANDTDSLMKPINRIGRPSLLSRNDSISNVDLTKSISANNRSATTNNAREPKIEPNDQDLLIEKDQHLNDHHNKPTTNGQITEANTLIFINNNSPAKTDQPTVEVVMPAP